MYTEAHEKIREDPTGEPTEKKDRMFAFGTAKNTGSMLFIAFHCQHLGQDITYERDGDTMKALAVRQKEPIPDQS